MEISRLLTGWFSKQKVVAFVTINAATGNHNIIILVHHRHHLWANNNDVSLIHPYTEKDDTSQLGSWSGIGSPPFECAMNMKFIRSSTEQEPFDFPIDLTTTLALGFIIVLFAGILIRFPSNSINQHFICVNEAESRSHPHPPVLSLFA